MSRTEIKVFIQSLDPYKVASCLLVAIVGCQEPESGVVDLAGERSVVMPSGRDLGLSPTGVQFIDTGTPASPGNADQTPNTQFDNGCEANIRRSCSDGCGVQFCVNDTWSNCSAGPEACNGDDDDCDGEIDEGLGVGTGCTNRQDNGCLAQGRLTCDTSGSGIVCLTNPMEPTAEICDGIDNDCDGRPDEDFPDQRCCTDDFQCPPGATCASGECTAGNRGGGSGPQGPQPGDTCATFLDCGFGQTCAAQICQAICFTAADCGQGRVCGCPSVEPNCFFTACLDPATAAP